MTINEVLHLYFEQGMSTKEIAEHLGKSVWQIIGLMRKNKIKFRTSSETQKIQFQRKPLSYRKKLDLTNFEKDLLIAGLSLYWTEGVKTGGNTVDFANSDPRMAKIFLKMLRLIYRVDEARLRVLVYCYANQSVTKLENFWANLLEIAHSQFIKTYVRTDYKEDKSNKMPKGLVHVRYNDKKLFAQIHKDIDIMSRGL